MRFLLDVNALVVLAFPESAPHGRVFDWFRHEPNRKWATCPLTQSGFLRQTMRTLGNTRGTFQLALRGLERDCLNPHHEYWPVGIDLTDLPEGMRTRIVGPNQITDLQLLLLAHKHHGQLATLDTGIAELARGTRYANSLHVI